MFHLQFNLACINNDLFLTDTIFFFKSGQFFIRDILLNYFI